MGGERVTVIAVPRMEYVARASLQVTFDRAWLADEGDVDDNLTALKDGLMAVIRAGKRVQVQTSSARDLWLEGLPIDAESVSQRCGGIA